MTTKITIGANCAISLGESTTIKVRQFGTDGAAEIDGTLQTIQIDSTAPISGTGTIYHSFSRTGEPSRSTIADSIHQINIDEELVYGLYDPAFEGSMQRIFGDLGPLAVFAMGIPFILLEPKIPKDDL